MTLKIAETPPLSNLHHALDAAFDVDRASAEFGIRVRAALSVLRADGGLLTEAQRAGSLQSYTRHLLHADPLGRYAVAALIWQPGQASPVHGHHTWCAYTVLEGALSETLFSWNPETHCAVKTRQHARPSGAVSFVAGGRGAIHQLGNVSDVSDSSGPAISIHVYGVDGTQIATHVNDLVAVA